MSMSRLVKVVNDQSERSGVEVSICKQTVDGSYVTAGEGDLAAADFGIKLGQVVDKIAALPRSEKLEFSKAMRDAGNERFYAGDYQQALEMYAQAMAGFDGDRARLLETKKEIALPILNNMAFCLLAMGKPRHALEMCDEALKIDPTNAKALVRKGNALARLDRYVEARATLEQAGVAPSTDETFVDKQIHKVDETTKRVSRIREMQRVKLKEAFAHGLYSQNRGRQRNAVAAADDAGKISSSSSAISAWLRSPGCVGDTVVGDILAGVCLFLVLFYVLFGETLELALLEHMELNGDVEYE